MRTLRPWAVVLLLLSTTPVSIARAGADSQAPGATSTPAVDADIEVRTSLSQTALWLGSTVTFTVSLTCQPGVDVLQEDLGADKLTLEGLQVVGHTLNRRVTPDGRTHYDAAYRLTTFEPGAETLTIGDWTVRYTAGAQGVSQPARDLRIPGAVVAWRSALPAALKTLEARSDRVVVPAPRWWRAARPAGIALLAGSAGVFGWLLFKRVSAGRTRKPPRSLHREAARDLQGALRALRDADVSSAVHRLAAYETLDAAVRSHVSKVTALSGSALTPGECRDRLAQSPVPFSADAIGRILSECQDARYQPVERLPGEDRFHATLDTAAEAFARAR